MKFNQRQLRIPLFILLFIILPVGAIFAASFNDNNESSFNLGNSIKTLWNTANNRLELFDTVNKTELPDNAVSSSWLDMTNNVLLLHMNDTGSTTTADSSGNSNTGTQSGGPTFSFPGQLNNALLFDGVDDYLTVTDSATLDPSSAITISAWVKPSLISSYPTIVSKQAGTTWVSPYARYMLRIDTGSANRFGFWAGSYSGRNLLSTTSAQVNQWTHVVATYDGSTEKIYVNGVLENTLSVSGSIPDSIYDLAIGSHGTGANAGEYFKGVIDEVGIWSEALTDHEIKLMYDRQAPSHQAELPDEGRTDWWFDMSNNVLLYHLDETAANSATGGADAEDTSGNGNHAVESSGVGYAVSSKGQLNNAFNFDSSGEYIQTSSDLDSLLPSGDPFSFCAWAKATSANAYQKIGGTHDDNDTPTKGFSLHTTSGGNVMQFALNGSTLADPDTFALNEWNYWCGTYDGTTARLYRNASLKNSSSASYTISSTTFGVANIGDDAANFDGAENWRGDLDEISLWDKSLTAVEIKTIYDQQKPLIVSQLPNADVADPWFDTSNNLLNLHLDEPVWNGTSNEVIDSSTNGNHGTSSGGAFTTADGKTYRAGSFDGVNDYTINALNGTALTNFSINLWFKKTTTTQNGIFQWANNLSSGAPFVLLRGTSGTAVDWYVDSGYRYTSNIILNQWTNLSVTHDGSVWRFYQDGALRGSYTGARANQGNGTFIYLGNGYPTYFAGQIDEFSVFDRVLSDDEIKNLHLSQASKYSGSIESQIFDTGSSSSWGFLGWNSSEPFYKPLVNNEQVESSYTSGNIDMSNNVLLMHMDESSWDGTTDEVIDSSGNGNDGTAGGTVKPTTIASGRFDRGGYFDGVDDYVTTNATLGDMVGGSAASTASISMWVYPTLAGNSSSNSYAGRTLIGDTGGYMGLYQTNIGGYDHIWAYNHDGNEDRIGVSYEPNQWNHIAWVHEGGNLYLYKNGKLAGSVASGNTTSVATNIQLGDAYGTFFRGSMDEVAIFSDALTANEIQSIYRRGANRLRLQVRSCDDANCSGESFMGPDGTLDSYYSELNNAGTSKPYFVLSNVPDNQYFQYRTFFESDDPNYYPDASSIFASTKVNVSASVSTTAVNAAPIITGTFSDNGRDASSPVSVGSSINFNASVSDINLNQYYFAICASDLVTVGDDGPPTCDGAGNTYVISDALDVPTPVPTELSDFDNPGSGVDIGNNILNLHLDEPSWNGTAGEVLDTSGGGYNGQAFGNATTTASGQIDRAGTFDGSGDYTLHGISGTSLTTFSISLWFKKSTSAQNGIFQWANALSSGAPFILLRGTNGTTVDWYVNTVYAHSTSITLNEWTHMAITHDGSVWRFYQDGAYLTSYTGARANQANAASIYLGNGYPTYFNGLIDEFLIFDDVLTDNEIADLYEYTSPNSVAYQAEASKPELSNWYGFVCDKLPSADNPGCSPVAVSPGGDQGRAIGTLSFSSEPLDEEDFTIDSVQYRVDALGNGCVGAGTCIDFSTAQNVKQAADLLVASETGSNTHMVSRLNTVYVYANTKGSAGTAIEMSFSTCTVCTLNGGTEGDGTAVNLIGGSDANASPFYINHNPTFGTAYIGDSSDRANLIYPDVNGVVIEASTVGTPGNGVQLVVVDDNATDCEAALPASLASHITESDLTITLTCDIDISSVGSDIVNGIRLRDAINHASDPTNGVVTASILGTGSSQITATSGTYLTNVSPGDLLTFTLSSNRIADEDVAGGQDTVQMHVCPSGNSAFDYVNDECDGATAPICSSAFADPTGFGLSCSETTTNLVTGATPADIYDVEIYLEDDLGLAGVGTNTQNYRVFVTPIPQLLAYTAVDEPTPPAGGSDTVTFSVTIEDSDGESDVTNVKGVFFDPSSTGVGNGGEGTADCVANEQNCYIDSSCTLNTAYGDSNQLQADCSVDVWFNANASDWDVQVEVTDSSGVTEFADASVALTNLPLLGLDIVENTINYGTLEIGKTSTGQETSIGNVGNQEIDLYLLGSEMTCVDTAACIANPIPVAQQKWHHTSNDFIWGDAATSPGPYTLLSDASGTDDETGCLNRDIAVRTDHTSEVETNESIYWQLKLPSTVPAGSYSGSNTILGAVSSVCSAGASY